MTARNWYVTARYDTKRQYLVGPFSTHRAAESMQWVTQAAVRANATDPHLKHAAIVVVRTDHSKPGTMPLEWLLSPAAWVLLIGSEK